MYKTQ